ncbi:MAG: SusE domain-containing protein [Bacteroidetes bacterium]|nr:SusE domain-containing protein [Bacteroidota bacterium]
MKYIKSAYLYYLLAGLFFASCNNDDIKVTYLGGGAPTLTLSSTSDLVLTKALEDYSTIQLQWTNPGYSFSNGASTQDVFYALQIDTTGSNFTNPKMVSIAYTNDVSHTFTVKELNTVLSGLELADFKPHSFEFRVKAALANGNEPQYSAAVKINITTYLDVVYPVPAKLYITGDATPGNWMGGGDPELTSQKFTKVNSYSFVLQNFHFVGGSGFLFVPVYGDWNNKYGFTGAKHGNNASGDTFKPGGEDFQPPVTGTYKITVNFKTGKYSIE